MWSNNYNPRKISARLGPVHRPVVTFWHVLEKNEVDEQIEDQISLPEIEDQISLPEIEKNEAITIEPTEAEIDQEKVLNFIENRLKPNFPWLQLSDGKLFCKVRNIHIASSQGNVAIFCHLARLKH